MAVTTEPTETPDAEPRSNQRSLGLVPTIIVLVISAVFLFFWVVMVAEIGTPLWGGGSGGNGGGASTPRAQCEQNWEANRSTAESPVMTEETYIANCLEGYETVADIKRGG